MISNDKNQPAKIFCLFHKKNDCDCIAPVTDNKILKMRLEHGISLNTILNRHATDSSLKDVRSVQIDDFAARLENLQM